MIIISNFNDVLSLEILYNLTLVLYYNYCNKHNSFYTLVIQLFLINFMSDIDLIR